MYTSSSSSSSSSSLHSKTVSFSDCTKPLYSDATPPVVNFYTVKTILGFTTPTTRRDGFRRTARSVLLRREGSTPPGVSGLIHGTTDFHLTCRIGAAAAAAAFVRWKCLPKAKTDVNSVSKFIRTGQTIEHTLLCVCSRLHVSVAPIFEKANKKKFSTRTTDSFF